MTSTNHTGPRFQPRWTVQVTLKRLLHQWRSLLTMIAGVLLAAVIGAGIPLYTAAVGQVGLQQTLANAAPARSHLALRTGVSGLARPAGDQLDGEVRMILSDRLGRWLDSIVRYEETLPLPPERDGEVIPATRLRLGYFEGWEEHADLEDGAFPDLSPPAGADVEAAISLDLAQVLNLAVGDEIVLREGRASSTSIRVVISGLVQASDPEDPYWPNNTPPMQPAEPVAQWEVQGTLLIASGAFYPLVESYLPETTTNMGWRALMDHPAVTLPEIPAVLEALAALNPDLERAGASYVTLETDLGPLLSQYAHEAELLGAPFGLLIVQMGALTLYFLLMTAELIRHSERREISLMRSRGGMAGQVFALRGLEALLICLLMVAIAPWLARAGLQQAWRGMNRAALPLEVTPAVYVYAAAAGLASWAALMLTLRPVLKASLVTAAGVWDRPEKQAWWQRTYLDLALLVLGGVAYWQLSSYGAVIIQQIRGELVIDPLLLLTPSLLMLAVGALLLRLFPPAMNLIAFLLSGRDGVAGQMAGWQISRRPVHYGRIALMLALAIGMGWFATGFNATVSRSQTDRAAYAAGADLRLAEVDTLLGRPRNHPQAYYTSLENVSQASLAFRSRINAATRPGNSVFGEILGIDSATFGLTANWREDLGVLFLPGASRSGSDPAGRLLAPTPYRLGLWVRMPGERPHDVVSRLTLAIKIEDDDGTLVNIPLQFNLAEQDLFAKIPDRPDLSGSVYAPTGWLYAEADLTQTKRPLVAPLRLRSIHWTYRSAVQFGGAARILFSDLTLYDGWGNVTDQDWLNSLVGWRFLDDGISLSQGSLSANGTGRGSCRRSTWTGSRRVEPRRWASCWTTGRRARCRPWSAPAFWPPTASPAKSHSRSTCSTPGSPFACWQSWTTIPACTRASGHSSSPIWINCSRPSTCAPAQPFFPTKAG